MSLLDGIWSPAPDAQGAVDAASVPPPPLTPLEQYWAGFGDGWNGRESRGLGSSYEHARRAGLDARSAHDGGGEIVVGTRRS